MRVRPRVDRPGEADGAMADEAKAQSAKRKKILKRDKQCDEREQMTESCRD